MNSCMALPTQNIIAIVYPTELGTIAHEMKRAQYQTAIFGKWHLGIEEGRRPEDNGFDETFVLPHGGHGMYNMNPVLLHNGELVKCKGFSTEVIIGQTLSWIKSAKDKQDPFFIYLPTPAPHGPYKENIPAEWKTKWLDQGYNHNVPDVMRWLKTWMLNSAGS